MEDSSSLSSEHLYSGWFMYVGSRVQEQDVNVAISFEESHDGSTTLGYTICK
jgi:hypothetical protein